VIAALALYPALALQLAVAAARTALTRLTPEGGNR
jgi:hypothetical protein